MVAKTGNPVTLAMTYLLYVTELSGQCNNELYIDFLNVFQSHWIPLAISIQIKYIFLWPHEIFLLYYIVITEGLADGLAAEYRGSCSYRVLLQITEGLVVRGSCWITKSLVSEYRGPCS